jgi:putative acetyltransferase
MDKKLTIKEEKEFLERNIKAEINKTKIFLIAKDGNKVVGNTSIERGMYRRSHIGRFAIGIANGYRGKGLGKYLMSAIIERAKNEFDPKLEIIQLEVHANNKAAIALYKKMGFKRFARLPKQIQHKGRIDDELIMIKFL